MSKKILIVDDMLFMRTALRKILESNGYEIVGEGENGLDGVEKFKRFSPDIVTMDITMPEMDGLEALKKIKEINPGANVVMVSAMGQEKNIFEAVKLGAKNFIVKPFKAEKVIEVMESLK